MADQLASAPASLTAYFEVLEDADFTLSLDDVQRPEIASRFRDSSAAGEALNYGFTRSAYWLRLRVRNASSQPVDAMLEVSQAALTHIEFHQPTPQGSYQSVVSGYALPFATRPYPNRFYVYPLQLAAQVDQVFYLRVQSSDALVIPARLWRAPEFYAHARDDYFGQAWYFGMASAMVLFNLLLFFALRDRIYLNYVLFVTCSALAIAARNGLAQEFLWPQATLWSDIAHFVGYAYSLAGLLLFMRQMLDTAHTMPRLHGVLGKLAGVLFAAPLGFAVAWPTFAEAAVLLFAATAMLIFGVGLWSVLQRQRSAYFFLIAFSMLLFGGMLTALRSLGVLPTNVLTVNGMQFGSALEMVLLAFALADRFNAVRKEKARAQTQALQAQGAALEAQAKALQAEHREVETLRSSERLLELRVAERTAELSATIDRLKQTQDELVQSEKLASLGSLVAGVSHELNTPIGIALTTASTLEDRSREFQRDVKMGVLKRSALDTFLQQNVEMGGLLVNSCHRATSLIHSFKQVAVDQTTEQQRQFSLRALVDDNLAALLPSLKAAAWKVEVHVQDSIACDSYPGPLGHVLVNLIQNAAIHAFEDGKASELRIDGRMEGDAVELAVSDNGKGMDAATLSRIFDPFFTTRLGQGSSGLGLAICRNIVTGVLGGNLQVSSTVGAGTRFVIRFPSNAPR